MKRLVIISAAIISVIMSVIPAFAQDWEKGFQEVLDAFNAGDYDSALLWFTPLAEKGNASAQTNLGVMYRTGKGVPKDYAEAVEWYRLAAEQGHASAQTNLGVMFDRGQGVAQDNVLAHMWYNLGAANGSKNGPKNRDSIAEEMTREDISKAQSMASECMSSDYKNCGY
ncbi:MAG: tetratricopeptide repeat protein [Tateyamaria sp.]|nr:tetratricopeptide repeat protein [Tateyamaria sp.]